MRKIFESSDSLEKVSGSFKTIFLKATGAEIMERIEVANDNQDKLLRQEYISALSR